MRRPHPHRLEVLLAPKPRPDGDWSVQCSLDCGKSWRDTGLMRSTRLSDPGLPDLQSLVAELGDLRELNDVAATLHLGKQRKIGWLLFRSLFGERGSITGKRWLHLVPHREPDTPPGDVAFDYDDFLDFVLRLPWPLMTDSDLADAQALARRRLDPIAVTLDGGFDLQTGRDWFEDVRLPPFPHILLIVPDDTQEDPTYGARHLEALRSLLEPAYVGSGRGDCIRSVATYDELHGLLGANVAAPFTPHVIYYYGHAAALGTDTVLEMGDRDVKIAEVETLLAGLVGRSRFPPVVWINGCQSGAASVNSGVRSLARHASAVIATRTLAEVEDARALGETVLPRIALGGWSPSSAMRDALAAQNAKTVNSARWATPIVAIQYRYWTALAPEAREELDRESYGDIAMRLDRVEPLGAIAGLIRAGMDTHAKNVEIVLWRGALAHGPDLFESRFCDLVRERFTEWSPIVRRVELGLDIRLNRAKDKSSRETQAALDAEFRVGLHNALTAPSERLATRADGELDLARLLQNFRDVVAGERCIVVLSHGPYENVHRPALEHYVKFWHGFYRAARLDPARCRVVVGLGLSGGMLEPLSLDGVTNIELSPVSPKEVLDHVNAFSVAYDTLDPDALASDLAERGSNAFRPIYDGLRAQLRLPKDDGSHSRGSRS